MHHRMPLPPSIHRPLPDSGSHHSRHSPCTSPVQGTFALSATGGIWDGPEGQPSPTPNFGYFPLDGFDFQFGCFPPSAPTAAVCCVCFGFVEISFFVTVSCIERRWHGAFVRPHSWTSFYGLWAEGGGEIESFPVLPSFPLRSFLSFSEVDSSFVSVSTELRKPSWWIEAGHNEGR